MMKDYKIFAEMKDALALIQGKEVVYFNPAFKIIVLHCMDLNF